MQTATVSRPALARGLAARFDPAVAGIWVLAFALPLYLALKGGGYDGVIRGQVGIAVWWAVIVGAAVGVLPRSRPSRAGWVLIGVMAAFTAWTLASTAWSSSSERSVFEASRLVMHLGVLVLGVCAVRRDVARNLMSALAASVAVIGILALLSRLHPAWFPMQETGTFLPSVASRLSYPVNYWNASGALLAIGTPLLLYVAASARTLVARACAAAALPLVLTALYLTYSRGSILALGVAVVVLVVAWPSRLGLLATMVPTAAGTAILAASVAQRHDLADGLGTDLATRQGSQVLVLAALVAIGCGLLQVAIALVDRYGQRPATLRPSPRRLGFVTLAVVAVAIVVAIGAGAPHAAVDGWQRFKKPDIGLASADRNTAKRLTAVGGQGRYQLWQSAVDAFEAHPLTGIGAGTYEYWWARHGSLPAFVRNAHSLWLETLGELGAVGLLLVLSLALVPIATGIRRLTAGGRRSRTAVAALAGFAAFCLSASFDWIWQVTVVPVVALQLAAVLVARVGGSRSSPAGWPTRVVLVAAGLVAVVLIALPLAGLTSVRESQRQALRDNLPAAQASASIAHTVQPYAATPRLQEALLYERAGALDRAAAAARAATDAERTNWRIWFVLSRIEAERGRTRAAVRAYRQSKALNPTSPIFRG